jgi:hypothetical protein
MYIYGRNAHELAIIIIITIIIIIYNTAPIIDKAVPLTHNLLRTKAGKIVK